MDFVFARGRDAAVVAVVFVACSSNSNGSNSSGDSDDGGRAALAQDAAADGGSSSAASGYDAAVEYDAAIAACASATSETLRVACCQQQIPRGYLSLHDAQQACLCGASGPCTSACNYQDCISLLASTAACLSCLDTNLAGTCEATVASACARDPGCVAYQACVQGGSS